MDLVKAFAGQSSATVHEAMGRRGALHSSIKPLCSGMRACGLAVTVKCQAGDNLMLLKALDMAEPGDVLVADMGGLTEGGPWGELASLQAVAKGLKGFVTNGSVRDALAIKELGFPVFCKAVSIKGTVKESLGYINYTISCGGVVVNPGDIILGDEDGVVVIPLLEAEEVLAKAKERVAKEQTLAEAIHAGKSLFEMLGFHEILKQKGCMEEE